MLDKLGSTNHDLFVDQDDSQSRPHLYESETRTLTVPCACTHIQDKLGDDGKPLVELPGNYLAMVESLLAARRHEYAALDGWLGPTRFQSKCKYMSQNP